MASTTRTTLRLATVAFAAALAITACGSSSGGSATATTAAGSGAYGAATTTVAGASAATTTAAPSGADLVGVKKNDKLGSILTNAKKATLYTLTDASGKAVDCTGPCLTAWPPAVAPAGTTTVSGASGVTLAVADGPSGSKIITAGGLPLYTFVQDKDDEDAYGEGITSFGGTWHVVKVG